MDPDQSPTAPAVSPSVNFPVAMASTIGPMILQFYPLPGLLSEGDHFYYAPVVAFSCGDFAAFVAYATHYDLPLVIHTCPGIVALQESHPWGQELLAIAPPAAQGVSAVPPGARSASSSSQSLSSLLSHISHSAASHGADPPSFLGDPVRPSLYWWFQRVLPPRSVVSSMSDRIAPTPMPSMFLPLLGGVGLVFELLVLLGGGIIIILPVGSFLLWFMGGFLLTPPHLSGGNFLASALTAEQWRAFTFPGNVPTGVPSFIYGGSVSSPIHGHSPHAPTLVAPSVGVTTSTLQSLLHDDAKSLSASDLTMSFLVQHPPMAWPSSLALASTPAFPKPPFGPLPASLVSPPVTAVNSLWSSKPIKIPAIKAANKAYLDHHELIQYYLWLTYYIT